MLLAVLAALFMGRLAFLKHHRLGGASMRRALMGLVRGVSQQRQLLCGFMDIWIFLCVLIGELILRRPCGLEGTLPFARLIAGLTLQLDFTCVFAAFLRMRVSLSCSGSCMRAADVSALGYLSCRTAPSKKTHLWGILRIPRAVET